MFKHSVTFMSIFMICILTTENIVTSVYCYDLHEPTFQLLKQQGIQISIPDVQGMQFFAFHGNVNRNIKVNELGKITGEVYKKKDEKWTVENKDVILRNGDVIHYWIYVLINETAYQSGNKKWIVTFAAQTRENHDTERSNDLAGELIFNEDFDSLNKSIWNPDIKIPLSPDYKFCVYHNEYQDFLVKVENGTIRIQPAILEDYYGENITAYGKLLLNGCTSNIPVECARNATSFNILPPIISARLTTKDSFYFRYGKIEIKAKFPEADWLYPEMWLDPKYNNYGVGYSSGRIILGLARGNDNLVNINNNTIFDSRRLEFGFRVGTTTAHIDNRIVSKIQDNSRWTKKFHVYTTIWNSNGFQFLVDNECIGKLSPESSGWLQNNNMNQMAPFDQEFYITIGVGAGGVRIFPDDTTSSGYAKPWTNVEAKAMLQFWRARNQWLPSFKRKNSKMAALEIDYIRVWTF